MKTLYIFRHAKSSWDQEDIDDMVRPLNEKGRASSALMGGWLKKQKIKPDLVISSPATRALHTAIIISSWVKYPKQNIQIDTSVYFGSVRAILSGLQDLDENEKAIHQVFLVGHEPILSELVNKLSKDIVEKFPTSAMYSIHWNVDSWAEALQQKGAKVDFITPKLLSKKN